MPIPLPLTNGAFVFDNTMLEVYGECSRKSEYSQFRRRLARAWRPGLDFGTALHLCLEHRYAKYGADLSPETLPLCEAEQVKILEQHFAANPPESNDWRGLNWAHTLFVKEYNKRYALEPFNLLTHEVDGKVVPMVEVPFAIKFAYLNPQNGVLHLTEQGFAHPLTPVIFAGKIDLPVLWDERLFIMDHKTTSMLGDRAAKQYAVSPQQAGYSYAWWKTTGQVPTGFVVDLVRTKEPPLYVSKPEEVKKGKKSVEAWMDESFYRCKEYIDERHLSEWEQNTLAILDRMFWEYNRGYFPLNRNNCIGKYGECMFYNVCNTQPASSRLEMLESDSCMDNVWTPLKQ